MTKRKRFNQTIKVMSLLFVSPTPICFLLGAGVGGGGGGEGGKGPDNAHMLTVSLRLMISILVCSS